MNSIKIVQANNWFRLLKYLIIWFVCEVIAFIPLFILYPNSLKGDGFQTLMDSNLLFVGLTQLSAVTGAAVATYIMIKRIEKRTLSEFNLTINLNAILTGFILGTFLMILFVLSMLLINSVEFSYSGISWNFVFSIFLFLVVSVSEEVVVRGYILNNLREILDAKSSILLSSLIFGAFHLFNDHIGVIGFLNIFLSGVLMGTLCFRTNSVSAPIGLHWAWNFFQGPVAGFSVSGQLITGIFKITPISSPIITGGFFGAEGSIVMIPITLIFIYYVWNREKFFHLKFLKKPI